MGDRVAVLKDGLLHAVRHPAADVRPPEQRVRGRVHRLAAMNLLDLPTTEGGVQFGDVTYPVERDLLSAGGRKVTLGVRPEDLELSEHGIPCTVEMVEELGADAYVFATLDGSDDAEHLDHRAGGRPAPADEGRDGALHPEGGARAPVPRTRAASAWGLSPSRLPAPTRPGGRRQRFAPRRDRP